MRPILTLFCLLSFLFSNYGQTFQIALGGAQEEFFYSFQETQTNGFIMAGRTYSFGTGGWESYLVRFNNIGDTLWARTYGNVLYDEFQDVDITSDGGFIAVGHTTSTDALSNVYIVKTNGSGSVVWSKEYGGGSSASDKAYSVCPTTDGGYVITGTTASYGSGSDDVYVLKIDATGNIQWTTVIGTSGANEAGREVIQTADGGYAIAGYTDGSGTSFYDVYLIKLSSNGTVSWKKTFGGSSYDFAYTVQQTTDGGFVLGATTNSFGTGNWDALLIKTDVNGTIEWSRTFGKTGEDRVQCARQTSDGGYIMCGRSSGFGAGSFDATLLKTDANGNLLWTKAFGGTGDDQSFCVKEIAGSSYVVCGYTVSYGAGAKDGYLIRTDGSGTSGCSENVISGVTTSSPVLVTGTIGNISTGGMPITPATAIRGTLSVKTTICSALSCSVNAGNDQVVCEGTAVTLTANGADTYSWSNGVQNAVAFTPQIGTQTYTVTGTTGSCTATDEVTVTVNQAPAVSAGNDQVVCEGGTVVLTATGADSYSWSNGVQNGIAFTPQTGTQNYTVTGTTGSCAATDQVTVTVNQNSSSTISQNALDSYTLNGQTYNQSGTYTQIIPNAVGCDSTITLILTLGFSTTEELKNVISVCPNPASNTLIINSVVPLEQEFFIIDQVGRIVHEGFLDKQYEEISIDSITTGHYFLIVGQQSIALHVLK